MAVLIDSSVFIFVERQGFPPERVVALITSEESALASITASELLIGVHRADTVERRAQRQRFVETIFDTIPVLPFDLRTARAHTSLAVFVAAAGTPIGVHDLIIAATALANQYEILTRNPREFRRVPGLAVREPDWS